MHVPSAVTPALCNGKPEWHHHHGAKMRVRSTSVADPPVWVIMASEVAHLLVQRKEGFPGWSIAWNIRHADGNAQGVVSVNNDELAALFGLETPETEETSRWLVMRYGADWAKQGLGIRYRDWLTLPCPGTGHDGDPNISIDLDDEVRTAIGTLLASAPS